jgi:hypothetical protein
MAQSVSNEALWVKLSEMDKKLDKLSEEQESAVLIPESAENKPDFTAAKEEIVTKIKDEISILGLSSDSQFKANTQNIETIIGNILKVLNVVHHIRKHQKEVFEPSKEKESHFNFWFFRVRKTSFAIAMLVFLVFILTLFCMKQQNDYSLLMDEYYRQGVEMREVKAEVDSLNVQIKTSQTKGENEIGSFS